MQNIHPPGPLRVEGNKAELWKKWLRNWRNFSVASGLTSKPPAVQTATFLSVIGDDGLDIYDTFKWTEAEDSERLDNIIRKFEEYFQPRRNVTFERHVFNKRNQKEGESVDDYVQALKTLARTCEYGDLMEGIIKDRIIAGLTEDRLRERLLERPDINLDTVIDVLRAAEATKAQAIMLCSSGSEKQQLNVDVIKKQVKQPFRGRQYADKNNMVYAEKNKMPWNSRNNKMGLAAGYSQDDRSKCAYCGLNHKPRSCPAFGETCYRCNKKNHYARMCKQTHIQYQKKKVAVLEEDTHELEEQETFFIGTIEYKQQSANRDWHEILIIHNKQVRFKLDTGAQCSVMPKAVYELLTDKPLQSSKVRLKSYTKELIQPVGQTTLTVEWNKTRYKIHFQVVDGMYEPIIGKDDLEKMHMIIRNVRRVQEIDKSKMPAPSSDGDFLKDYEDLFGGLGKLPGEYRIKLDPKVDPVVHPPRQIPHALVGKVRDKLQQMERDGIIEKVPNNEPTDWVNSMVTVLKPNGDVRICLDPRDLNNAIKREHHPLITVEEVAAKVKGAKFFSLLDAKNAFYQIVLSEQSSKYLTFNTPFGRYRYLRMPMGIKSASEIFQRRMHEMLEGVESAAAGMDDVLIWGQTESEHDINLKEVLERMRSNGLQLERRKCKVKQKDILFHGHRFTSQGLMIDETKCEAIREMPAPQNKDQVRGFMGMINYVGKFIPNLAEISAPIRELLKKEVAWHWTDRQQESFETLRKCLTTAPVLRYYDVTKPLVLQVDASSKGMGAALLQEGRPVAYASKALTTAQEAYSQIEKEMLAITFGCAKFENYIIGRDVVVESDHKPLESITRKPLYQAPLRLQRMMIQMQRYPGVQVRYKKGVDIPVADVLSRAFRSEPVTNDDTLEVNLLQILPISEDKLQQFISETNSDEILLALKQTIQQGWPEDKSVVAHSLREFWNFRDELTVINDLVFKGHRLLVPKTMQREMLAKLHQSHFGVVKTKQRARELFFWSGMSSQIEEMIAQCKVCAEHARANCKEPLIPHEIPSRPWAKVAADLFTFQNQNYILCVDYYSKFPEVSLLKSTTSEAVICSLKSIFARHGIPDTLVSDNGPQFSSVAFKNFASTWDFEHHTSSPLYPQSNGQAERMVQTVKNMLRKASDPYIALLEYRCTPLDGLGQSPSQLLMGRRLKSVLPMSAALLNPVEHKPVGDMHKTRQATQKRFYDRTAHSLPPLSVGARIRYADASWREGKIERTLPFRSYVISTDEGGRYRRNRQHLRPAEKGPTSRIWYPIRQWSDGIIQTARHEANTNSESTNRRSSQASRHDGTENIRRSSRGRVLKAPQRLDL